MTAPRESTFSKMALIGSTTLPVNRNNRMKVLISTQASARGSASSIPCWESV